MSVSVIRKYQRVAALSVVLYPILRAVVHRFPADPDWKRRWIAALNRKDWEPNEHTWLCGQNFISGTKSDDPLDPDFVPLIFKHVSTPMKRKMKSRVSDYRRRKGTKKRRIALLEISGLLFYYWLYSVQH